VLHLHAALGLADGTTRGGHLLEGRVYPTLEAVVTETPAELRKVMRPDVGLALIDGPNRVVSPAAAPMELPGCQYRGRSLTAHPSAARSWGLASPCCSALHAAPGSPRGRGRRG
jgi:hypothetical protein